MADLIAITYPDEAKAEAARTVLRTSLDQTKDWELRDALDAHIRANPSS